jgi:uncharacterized protein (TIGR03086 family)
MIDLTSAARRTADLVVSIPDDALGDPTPCARYNVGAMLHHLDGLALAFTWAATKDPKTALTARGAQGDAALLEDGWRERIPERLDALAKAWQDPSAWEGMTAAGGVDLPGEAAGLIALDEVVVHGWDIARAARLPYDVPAQEAEACLAFVAQMEPDANPDDNGLFGPPVPVPDDASPLDRLIARTGRDPSWTPDG